MKSWLKSVTSLLLLALAVPGAQSSDTKFECHYVLEAWRSMGRVMGTVPNEELHDVCCDFVGVKCDIPAYGVATVYYMYVL